MSATKFHTHTKQQTKLEFCIYLSLNFWTANCEAKVPELSDNKHSLTSICYEFISEYNSDISRLFPNTSILTVPPFQRKYYYSLYYDFFQHSDLETWPCTYSTFITIISSPISLLRGLEL